MNENLTQKTLKCDICIIGGGLSGSFAAIEAAVTNAARYTCSRQSFSRKINSKISRRIY